MKVDYNEIERQALELFKQGKSKDAWKLQKQFLKELKESGIDHCSCATACPLHGKCVECVALHRGHGEHLPNCFKEMVNRKAGPGSGLTE